MATKIEEETRALIDANKLKPELAVILVGTNAASQAYVTRKVAAAERVGIKIQVTCPENATTESLVALIESLNAAPNIDAILVQLPLPENIDTDAVISAVDPKKDVDGFHPKNISAFINGGGHAPVLIAAINSLLTETKQKFKNKVAVIVGKSDVFTAPLSYALEQHGLAVSWTKPMDENLNQKTAGADVLVVAVGQPGIIRGENIKTGATIIDVGITRLPNGKVAGDVDAESVAPRAGFLTPTPGGVGPVTVAVAMRTVAELARQHAHVV